MNIYEKDLIRELGFLPKEKTSEIYFKKYSQECSIEVDFVKKIINYGKVIKSDSKTTQNFSQPENFVVLECVDRLLTKGYQPQDIYLEKVFPSGHGHSGRLDILVKKDKKSFLMIECKTWGKEFDKEYSNIYKNGGQLFTYFQNDTKSDYLMLYTSRLSEKNVEYKSEIIKIEDSYRNAGNVEDVYNRWSKITNKNGIFENWVKAYNFQNKLLTRKDLIPLSEEDSGKIFNSFASILRKHSVSDKPNAFNKIFNLFLAKIYDEGNVDTAPLEFQWKEGIDDPVEFQIRLINLHKAGVLHFLDKEISGIKDEDFKAADAANLKRLKKERLMFDKIFDIKEVFDDESFDDNFMVLKEVVQLLEKYQVRYPRHQQHLSDFFERLLTTGLKQEAGQFFTPVPIARFIVRCLPIKNLMEKMINQQKSYLPAAIDYAAGSGHFITEILETYQDIINELNTDNYFPDAKKTVAGWKVNPYDWASTYIYGIEKDYRLVKVAKVGCYFYGDGLAQVVHGDGLDSFINSKAYRGLLTKKAPQFDIVVSNPPYSVDAFKGDLKNCDAKTDFKLYENLTDRSSEIECLFVERTAQLLKEDGVAGIVLPSSILSNGGIYTKTREIILQKFKIIAIAELGSNTFMATGTNTVVLFLKRRNDAEVEEIKKSAYELANEYNSTKKDWTVNGIEKPISKYIKLTGQKEIAAEKFSYFVLTYPQNIVIVKTGDKDAEKHFLGYEFSNRRGSEGIHPIERGKRIEDCTKLFDDKNIDNPEKASSYIYRAFNNDITSQISESMKNNVFYMNLADMLHFDRKEFEKNISIAVKKRQDNKSKYDLVKLEEIAELYQPKTITSKSIKDNGKYKVFGANGVIGFYDDYNHEDSEVALTCRGATCGSVNYTEPKSWITGNAMVVRPKSSKLIKKFLFYMLSSFDMSETITGTAQPQITRATLSPFKIPMPPIEVQQKVVSEIEKIEKQEKYNGKQIANLAKMIQHIYTNIKPKFPEAVLSKEIEIIGGGTPSTNKPEYWNGNIPWLSIVDFKGDNRFVEITEKMITDAGLKNSSAKLLNAGDIIISARGTVGALAQLKKPMAFNQSCYGIKAKKNINVNYLYYALKFEINQFKNNAYGAIFDTITTKTFDSIKIPLPSLAEQKNIVLKIEKLESEIQNLQNQLKKIPLQREMVLKKYL